MLRDASGHAVGKICREKIPDRPASGVICVIAHVILIHLFVNYGIL